MVLWVKRVGGSSREGGGWVEERRGKVKSHAEKANCDVG